MAKVRKEGQTVKGAGAYARLARGIVLDQRLDADTLGLLAYRATSVGEYALNRNHLSQVLTVGDAVFDRAIALLRACGYISRRRAGDKGRRHARTIETLHLPALEVDDCYVFIR